MADKKIFHETQSNEVVHLREKLAEAEETLNAIRSGSVDALVVSGKERDCVYTLKGADHTYRVLIETMTEGAVILSEDGTILYCNSRFAEMVQTPIENVIGGFMIDFVDAFKKDRFADILKRALVEDTRVEIRLRQGAGDAVPVLVSMRPLSTEEMKSICMVVTDLTRQKQSERRLNTFAHALQKKNNELSRRAQQLARLTSELALTEERERRRLAEILHDHLQQLLVGVRLNLDAVSDYVAEDRKHTLETARTLLADSIQTSRSITAELSPPILYQSGLAAGLKWLSRWMQEKYGFSIELEMVPDVVVPQEDITVILFQSVRELLFNAVKHSGVDSAKVILSHDGPDRLRIFVSDSGEGFDPGRIWEISEQEGGFGLFAIRERLDFLGIRFEIESAPGSGASFTMIAPVENTGPVSDSGDFLHAASAKPSGQKNRKIRTLLVDDHAVVRQGFSMILDVQPDIEVAGEAADGEIAVRLAKELNPDVILMDISLPGINGIEATRRIHSEHPHIRIICLSMFEDHEMASSALQSGAAEYLSKSGDTDVLLSAIRGEGKRSFREKRFTSPKGSMK